MGHDIYLILFVSQNKCKAERNQAMQKQMSTSACSACAIEDLYFDTIPNFCTQCGCRIKRNATYYTTGSGESTLSFCGPCYSAIRHDTVETYGSRFQKSMLIKKKNDEQRAEGVSLVTHMLVITVKSLMIHCLRWNEYCTLTCI